MRTMLRGLACAVLLVATSGIVRAQDAGDDDAVAAGDGQAEEALLDEDELDELVAPVALYPDALLAQIFVAATYPLDVVKADRFVEDSADLSDNERADEAGTQDWDPSVQVLASGFPTVVGRMAEEIDWTEDLGDAMLAQTDDLLDAVQRMRARAAATGYLASNEAQVVETEDDQITIEPADPEVVYVPSYDSTAAFASAPTGAPVVYQDSGFSTTDALTTGAIAFGSAMLISEIFDDDDDDWDDYWRGPRVIDWDDDAVYARPRGVNVDGDVNVDVDRRREVNVDRSRTNIEGGDRTKIGDIDRSRTSVDNDGRWKPDDSKKRDARDRVASRDRPGGSDDARSAAQDKLKARQSGDGDDARAKLKAASADREPSRVKPKDSALKPREGGKDKAKAAANRGKSSAERSQAKARAKDTVASRPKAASPPKVSKPKVAAPKKVSKPKTSASKAVRKSPKATSAFQKHGSSSKAASAKKRGSTHKPKLKKKRG